MEIILYHRSHTQKNGSPTYDQHDLEFVTYMFHHVSQMSQSLKDHIWIQLNLRHIVKQIYDKHKAIWWQWINGGEAETRDDFIK